MSCIVYVDMDGVLVNFLQAANAIEPGLMDTDPRYHWPIINNLGAKFWAELEWMPDGSTLWDFLRKAIHPQKLRLLTARPRNGSAKPGKWIWIYKHMGIDWVGRAVICRRKEKKLFASDEHYTNVLIDDRVDTIKEWEDNGGVGIVHTDAKTTIEKVKKLICDGVIQ